MQMLTARNLNAVDRPLPEGHIEKWMWNGKGVADALKAVLPDGNPVLSPVLSSVIVYGSTQESRDSS